MAQDALNFILHLKLEDDTVKMIHADTEKYTRKQVGLNIKHTAEILDAPYHTIQNWFNGKFKQRPNNRIQLPCVRGFFIATKRAN